MNSSEAEKNLPPSPSLPIRETTFRWLARPYELLDDCAAEIGDCFTLRFARFGTHVIVSHPDDVRAVFTGDRETLFAGRGNALLAPILGRHSLLLTDGQRHSEQRSQLQPFFRRERAERYASAMAAAVRRWTAGWKGGGTVRLQRTALGISRDVILRIVLGADDAAVDRFSKLIEELMLLVGTNSTFDDSTDPQLLARFGAVRGALTDALQEEIERCRGAGTEGDDMLSSLMAANAAGQSLADEEIRDQLLTMILAGHETTASSITWGLICLCQQPETLARLEAELDDAAVDRAPERLASLPYLQAVCLETLRLRPVIPVVSREVQRPFRLREWQLPPGTFVTPCAYLAHRRADPFAEPGSFQPERFLGARFSPYSYFPFGGGAHRCLGMSFALFEMQSVVGMLVRSFRFEAAVEARPVRRAVTIVPSGGGKMHVERRPAH